MAHTQPRVDVVMALDLLTACVREFPPGHEVRRSGGRSLAELALAELGVTLDDLSLAPIVAEQHPVTGTADATNAPAFTIGAVVALRSAHRAELRGSAWERAFCAARHDVMRLLGVVPPAVFEAAAAQRSANVVPGR
jgi:hypothetical protein